MGSSLVCTASLPYILEKTTKMANLLEAQEDELCYVSIQDVKDSIDVGELTDSEIGVLIVQAQRDINIHLSEINTEISCDGIVVDGLEDCYEGVLVGACDEVPIEIQRATIYAIKNLIANAEAQSLQTTMSVGDVISETTACGNSLTYYQGSNSQIDPCDILDCNVLKQLECFETLGANVPLCKPLKSNCNSCN